MRQIHFDPTDSLATIQKLSFYAPSQGYLTSSGNGGWVGFTSDSGRTITKRPIPISNVDYNGYNVTYPFLFSGVKAFNKDTILVYGAYNTVPSILYSTDGGFNYLLVYYSPLGPNYISSVFDMAFPQNNAVGFAVDGYRILRTTNRGLSWSIINTDQNSGFGGIDAIDNNNLFVFSTFLSGTSQKLVKTSNAGATWQTVTTPNFDIMCADFISPEKGWINLAGIDHASLLYYTQNGGHSWTLRNNPDVTPSRFTDMQFINDSTGFSIGQYYQTYKTTDTGKIWEPIRRDHNFIYEENRHTDLMILNNTQLWAGGWRNLLELNTNLQAPPLPRAYFAIDITNVYTNNTVLLKNLSKPNYQYKWYINNTLISTAYDASYTHSVLSQTDSIVLIVTSGTVSDTLKKYQHFIVPNLPSISSFSPRSGSAGTEVMIYGTKFTGVNSVKFGGVAAQTFSVLSDTVIRAIVATGATGNVSVAVSGGSYSLPLFTYHQPPVQPPPVINSVNPGSGPIGTTVTITGNNFAPTSVNNIVYFGATRANVSASSSTQITCVVPVGASFHAISVLNTLNGLSGYSLRPFNVTFADSSNFTVNSFIPVLQYSHLQSASPHKPDCKDIDNDGKPDMIFFYYSTFDSITIYRNISTNNNFLFAAPKKIARGGTSMQEIDDLDGDGLPEIVNAGAKNNPNTVNLYNIYKNRSVPGLIQFDAAYTISPEAWCNDLTLDDIDGDGRKDLAVATNNFTENFMIARNTSSPGYLSFSSFMSFPTDANTKGIAVGDLDGDGKKDVVTLNITVSTPSAAYLSCSRNTSTPGNISFATRLDMPTTTEQIYPYLSLVDVNGDDKLDVVSLGHNICKIYLNNSTPGNISLTLSSFPVTTISTGLAEANIANLSGDAKPDYFWGSGAGGMLKLKRNTSTVSIVNADPEVPITMVDASLVNKLAAGDLNLDGKVDIITAGENANKFVIFENRLGKPLTENICDGTQKFIGSDLAGSSYQWQTDTGSGFSNLVNNSTFSGVQTGQLSINATLALNGNKFRCVVDGNLYSSITILQVPPQVVPSVTISTATTNVCAGATVTFTASPVNGGTNPYYQWYVNFTPITGANSSTFTTTFTSNNQVFVIMSSKALCHGSSAPKSNTLSMIITGSVPAVSIASSPSKVCANSPAIFTATPVNGGTNPSYQWQVNGINVGSNSPTFATNSLSSTSQVKVIMSVTTSCSTIATAESNVITVANSIDNASVTIQTSNTTVCATQTVTIFATLTNGGTNPSYQWFVNNIAAGNNSHSFSPATLTNGMEVKVTMSSNAGCQTNSTATSNVIVLTVNPPVTPTVTISANTTVIEGQSTSITALTTNGGTFPLLSWEDSTSTHTWQGFLGGTGTTFSHKPAQTGDKLRCTLQSNASCITSNLVTSNLLVFTVNTVTSIPSVPGISYGIKYYPNPVSTILYIDSLKLSDKWQTLDIVSVDGKNCLTSVEISNRTSVSVNVAHLPAGIYAAVFRRKNGNVAYLKFIKQ